jgi:hypothetical protein
MYNASIKIKQLKYEERGKTQWEETPPSKDNVDYGICYAVVSFTPRRPRKAEIFSLLKVLMNM